MARIIVAEDEEGLRGFVVRALALDGHEVTAAADGAEALDLIAQREGRFDLLLADIRMPVMDGIALALATARDYPQMIILLMTGYADQRERAHGLDALIHDVISKPFTLPQIRAAVNGALRADDGRQTRADR
ncbi:MAG: response regulator [Hyphomicrobiales bacterium]|nr:response regulator [Hyphomicrobiales bacterium]